MSRLSLAAKISAIVILFSLYFFLTTAHSQYLEFEGSSLFSNPNSVKMVGNFAYCAYTNGMMILDISDASMPLLIGQTGFEGSGSAIDVQGGYAYLGNGVFGLTIIDIGNPTTPAVVSNLAVPGSAGSIRVAGDYAYMTASIPNIVIVNIANPRAPVLVSTYNSSSYHSTHIFVRDSLLFYTGYYNYYEYSGGLCAVLNVADPANPVRINAIGARWHYNACTVSDTFLYVTSSFGYSSWETWDGGLNVFNISDLNHIASLGSLEIFPGLGDIEIRGNYIYAGYSEYGSGSELRIIDVADPSLPVQVGMQTFPAILRQISLVDSSLCLVMDKIYFLNLIDPVNPQIEGSYGAPDRATSVFVAGNYAYVNAGGLRILDISDPADQSLIASYDIGDTINDIFVTENYAFISSDSAGLIILDVSDPSHPFQAAGIDAPTNDIFVSGDYGYIIQKDSFAVLDLSNPYLPSPLGSVRGFSSNAEIAVSGNYAFVADDSFKVIDISDRSQPILRVRRDIPYSGYDIAISGNYAYVTAGGLVVLDISNPLNPMIQGIGNAVGPNADISVSGNLAYVSGEGNIKVFDIFTPSSPVMVQSYAPAGSPRGIYIEGNNLFVADYYSLLVFNLPPRDVEGEGYVTVPGAPQALAISGNYAFLAAGDSGLQVVDISTPSAPSMAGSLVVPGNATDVEISGNYAFLSNYSYQACIYIINIADPTHPVEVSRYSCRSYNRSSFIDGNYAFIAEASYGFEIIDISNPTNPIMISGTDTPGYVTGIFVSGNYAFIADGLEGFKIYDISNLSSPILLGSCDTPGYAYDIMANGNYAYLADYDAGLQIIDISIPAGPRIIGGFDTPGSAQNVFISGSLAFVADGGPGVHIIDIANPANPTLLDSYDTGGFSSDAVYRDAHIYVADYSHLLILSYNPVGVTEPQDIIPNDFELSQNYPNPFNAQTTIRYSLLQAANITIEIFDIAGRKVKMLMSGYQYAGEHRLIWDGTDARGDALASGVYFYRLLAGTHSLSRQMVMIK